MQNWIKYFLLLALVSTNFLFSEMETAISPVQVTLIQEEETVQPGRPFWVGIRFEIDDHWHTYWKHPGDIGFAPSISWNLPEGYEVVSLEWPYPEKFDADSLITYGYQKEVTLLAKVIPPKNAETSQVVPLAAEVKWLACNESNCLPGSSNQELQLVLSKEEPQKNPTWETHFTQVREKLPSERMTQITAQRKEGAIEVAFNHPEAVSQAHFFPESEQINHKKPPQLTQKESDYQLYLEDLAEEQRVDSLKGVLVLTTADGQKTQAIALNTPIEKPSTHSYQELWIAIALAFLGGMILNLMPCVLPVVSIKILSFVKMAGEKRSKTLKQGIAYSLGVIVSFWILAALLLSLQAGWGFQLQQPLFVASLAAILFTFGLSFFGVFELGMIFASWAGQKEANMFKEQPKGYTASFMSGILATAIATPCTGPFLGSAIGFAAALSAPWAMLIFTSIGMGMAFPYLLLSANPKWLRFLPKPGNWMVALKEFMGFIMIATVLWLIWVFSAQTTSLSVFLLLASFFFLSIGCWILGKWGTPIKSKATRLISYSFTALCLMLTGFVILKSTDPSLLALAEANTETTSDWETFSPKRIAELKEKKQPVFIDFTAKWCLICQANHLILSTEEVEKTFEELGVVKMKADWTKNDPAITDALKKHGRNGVPLYIYYDAEGNVEILPQVLTPNIVIETLNNSKKAIVKN